MSKPRCSRHAVTFRVFAGYLDDLIGQMLCSRGSRLSKDTVERIMLAVTQVNKCPICSYAHTGIALRAGLSSEEIDALLEGDLSGGPGKYREALLFAQHYAQTLGSPGQEACEQLVIRYGVRESGEILKAVRTIMVGNAYGNAASNLRKRLAGSPDPESSLAREAAVLMGIVPLVPIILVGRVLLSCSARKRRDLCVQSR